MGATTASKCLPEDELHTAHSTAQGFRGPQALPGAVLSCCPTPATCIQAVKDQPSNPTDFCSCAPELELLCSRKPSGPCQLPSAASKEVPVTSDRVTSMTQHLNSRGKPFKNILTSKELLLSSLAPFLYPLFLKTGWFAKPPWQKKSSCRGRKQQVISCGRSAAVSHQEACPSALCHGGSETLHPEIAVQILCSVDGAFLSPEDVIV